MPPSIDAVSNAPSSLTGESAQKPITDGKEEIAHVLFLDVVGFTKLSAGRQILVLGELQQIVRSTDSFRNAKKPKELIALPTGDGMALAFMNIGVSGVAISCARQIAEAVVNRNEVDGNDVKINVRMGIHSGTVVRVDDINGSKNVAGDGINTAQRVMDCGDAGHILLSDAAFHLRPKVRQESDGTEQFLTLGKIKVKHDQTIDLYSFYESRIGNQELPRKIRSQKEDKEFVDNAMAAIHEAQEEERRAQEEERRAQEEERKAREEGKRRWRQLQWAVGVFLLSILGALTVWAVGRPSPRPSFAVLPFQPTSPKDSSKAISKGLAEELDRSFAYFTDVDVVALDRIKNDFRPTTQSETSRRDAAIAAARKRGIRYVLTGTVDSQNDDANLQNLVDINSEFSVRINVELYDAQTEKRVWNEQYPSTFRDLITKQKEIVSEVTKRIGASLRDRGVDFEKFHTNQYNAHWYYLLGRYWSIQRQSADSEAQVRDLTDRVIQSYQKANLIDNKYALAYAGLADVYASISGNGMNPKKAREQAIIAAQSAQDSNEGLPEVYSAIGTEKWWLERDFSTARMAFLLADKINPQFADNHRRYSACLAALDKPDLADSEIEKAIGLEPESVTYQLTKGMNKVFAHKYGEAIEQLGTVIGKRPDLYPAYRFRAMAFAQNGMNQKALEELDKIKEKAGNDLDFLSVKAYVLLRLNRLAEGTEMLNDLLKLRTENPDKLNQNYISAYNIATIYTAMPNGQADALSWLKTAIEEDDPRVAWLKVDPRFDSLRTVEFTKEFKERLDAAGLPN